MSRYRASELQINLDQITLNYKSLRSLSNNDFHCPMVKADAYGHGAVEVTRALEGVGCNYVGVALYEEAIELRQAGVKCEILVFAPITKGCSDLAVEHSLTPVLLSDGDLQNLVLETDKKKKLAVHLKLNLGMNRMGFNPDRAREIIEEVEAHSKLDLQGLCTHFPISEDLMEESGQTSQELDQFLEFCEDYKVSYRHALNSAALLALSLNSDARVHQVGSRPGIALYGAIPELKKAVDLPIEEAMTLRTEIQHLQSVKKGQGVSYMWDWIAPEDSLIGILPIGYADGLRRGLSGRFSVQVEGESCSQVGIICMDYTLIDLTHAKIKKPLGAKVDLQFNSRDWASKLNTIPYEIMTGMGARLPRVYS